MIGFRAFLTRARCSKCRLHLTDAFPSARENLSLPISRPGIANLSLRNHISKRRITQLGTQHTEFSDHSAESDVRVEEVGDNEETQASQDLAGLDQGTTSEDSIPWYLQVEPPERESVTLSQRQKLPDLPSDPPPLLQPMLEHIFIDLGLDDVVLFDLRDLEPPPALGANLIMAICTARSEKHLHVSADKFCQWMKTKHQIAPYADGLLGRGELKLKLKRKAKRARILSRVGSTETNQADDGIRTGWICTTVDNIEDGRPIENIQGHGDDFVGFGSEEHGAKVIIQMLTQEKREELDLEELWSGTIRRYQRKQARISESLENPESPQEVGQVLYLDDGMRPDNEPVAPLSSFKLPRANPSQVRHMHSSTLDNPALQWNGAIEEGDQNTSEAAEHDHPETETTFSSEQHEDSFDAGQVETAPSAKVERQMRDSITENTEASELTAYVKFAETLTPEQARLAFGNGGLDTESTPFLRSFYDRFPSALKADHWAIWLSLLCMGTRLGAPGYSKHRLFDHFHELQSLPIEIPASSYKQILTALLTTSRSSNDNSLDPTLSIADLNDISSILKATPLNQPEFITAFNSDDSFRELLEMAILDALFTDDNASQSLHPEDLLLLRHSLNTLYPEPPTLDLQLQKMHACASTANLPGLWDAWRNFAVHMQPRSAEVYEIMFRLLADSGHPAKNMEALRVLVPEMSYEEPPVEMDYPIAEAIKRCISVADPKVEEYAINLYEDLGFGELEWGKMDGLGEFEVLWLECERVIEEAGRWARESDDDD